MPPAQHPEVPEAILSNLRLTCLDLPEAAEEKAWTGVRWSVGGKAFAHVLMIDHGWPPAYAKVAETEGPACVLTFRCAGAAREVPRFARAPFFLPGWWPNIVGMVLGDDTDWHETAALLSRSYCALAPKRLAAQVDLTHE